MAASAYFCGSRTHTSRSTSCTSRSTSRWWATSVESWSGRSSSTSPSERSAAPSSSRRTWWRRCTPSQSSTSARRPRPRRRRWSTEVVGRRTLTVAIGTPGERVEGRGLARTRWRRRARRRCGRRRARAARSARRTTVSARSTRSSSSLPRPASAACSSARSRSRTDGLAPADQPLGPLHERRSRAPLGRSPDGGRSTAARALAEPHRVRPGRAPARRARSSVARPARRRTAPGHPLLEVRRACSASRRTAWSPKTASSSFCPRTALPPAMPTSAPVTPAVLAKTTTISATDRPLTPKARNRAVVRLSAPSVAHHLQHALLPVADGPLGLAGGTRATPGRGRGPCRRRAAACRPRRRSRSARRRSAAASACSTSSDSRPLSTATVTRSTCCGLPRNQPPTRSRTQPTRDSRERSSSPVPTNSCQRASTSPRSRLPSADASATSRERLVVGAVRVAAEPRRSARPGPRGPPATLARAARPTEDGAVEGLPHDRRPRVWRRRRAPRASRGPGRPPPAGSSPCSSTGPSSTVNSGERSRPRSRQHLLQVRGDLVARAGGDPVEHDRHRGAALGRRPQEVPRHLVGVAGGRGDEQPQVGRCEQLGGQGAVADLDGVDVGGVEDRQAGGHGVDRHELERPRVASRPSAARQVGQDPGVVEPRRRRRG